MLRVSALRFGAPIAPMFRPRSLCSISMTALHAVGAVRGQSPHHRPRHQHRLRAERERLQDVGAAPERCRRPARRPFRRRHRRSDGSTSIGAALPVAAAVIGHDDAARALLDRRLGVLGRHHALDRRPACRRLGGSDRSPSSRSPPRLALPDARCRRPCSPPRPRDRCCAARVGVGVDRIPERRLGLRRNLADRHARSAADDHGRPAPPTRRAPSPARRRGDSGAGRRPDRRESARSAARRTARRSGRDRASGPASRPERDAIERRAIAAGDRRHTPRRQRRASPPPRTRAR